ncbi:aminopeptidase [Halobacillus halophilus]|uniref:Aminopeptidase n=1 Tax=Halobacillus halophilus (strain ATCC 35676 / DSM 2266 / JCM 20832 / KCTC 3685 / LMG 17431 / NBRC 102448 / NCIMB 2269) TaxID=866895 RepID=I0JPH4_HALH3|nr:M28 family peptidase [Halobacillus halophilus]ASF40080.1 aminopeptidase [Halobacillus halophilus]CCG46044.1 aminopeptidase [Halobacillus halophilus DSM 2266]
MLKKAINMMLAAGLILSSAPATVDAAPPVLNSNSDHAFDNKVIKKISADRLYERVDFLSEKPREAGTEGEYHAVQYIKEKFESYGYDTELQPFTFQDWYGGISSLVINDTVFREDVRTFNGSVNGTVKSKLQFVGLASSEEVTDSVKGKIALIERGSISFYEKIQNVLNKGAIGVIMFNREGAEGNDFGYTYEGQDIPAVAIDRETGLSLVNQLKSEEVNAEISVQDAGVIDKTSYNVIATMKPHKNKDNGQMITVGAHHDSVAGGPGANDDASGVSGVLELAKIMANTPTDTELRFMTFGAEEKGLIGSYYYAGTLSEDEVHRTVAHFQMDMIGSRDSGDLIMFTPDGEKNLVTDLGAAAGARVAEVVEYGQLGRSDHVPFFERGIPSALFIHAPLEPWYHSPEDTVDKISKDKLKETTEIVGAAVYQIARPDTPALENAQVAPGPVHYEFDDRPL